MTPPCWPRQLDLLHQYCDQWSLTVDAAELVLLNERRTQQAAVDAAQQAALNLAGQLLVAVSTFK